MRRSLVSLLACLALGFCACGSDHEPGSAPAASNSPSRAGSAAEVDWPFFGRVPERTHYIADAPDPPFHPVWQLFIKQLIEFPPDLAGNHLYVVNKTGELYAVHTATGKVDWQRNLDRDVTGPAYFDGKLYVGQYNGKFVAYDGDNGKPLWQFSPTGHLESSPLVVDGVVYFGDDSGDLYALDAETGKLHWKADAGPAIKASPSFHDGVIYYGDYGGNVHAVRAADGHQLWKTSAAELGGAGPFYGSPAIADNLLFETSTNGTLYALDLSGHEKWHFATHAPIYGSAAVAPVAGVGPTVFTGSYDHRLYALDAATGKQRWNRGVKGEIPGTPTIVGHTVYTSSFQTKRTTGFDIRTGKPTFTFGTAGYEPMVSDGRYDYLSGFETIWTFDARGD